MADFEEALNILLADPDAMGQILSLAGKLGGQPASETSADSQVPEGAPPSEENASEAPPPGAAPPPDQAPAAAPFPDLGQLEQMTRLFQLFQSTGKTSGEATALLNALRPFLQKERRQKLDRALRLAQLSQTARQAYALWKEGELHL